jgi:hypothetical protein
MIRLLGYLFLVMLIAAAALAGGYYHLDRQASAYVAKSVRPIYSDWSLEALKQRESVLVHKTDFERGARELFLMFGGALGPLRSAESPRGGPEFGWQSDAEIRGVFARYSVKAKFERGEAQLHFFVVKEDGTWRIAGLRIESEKLFDLAGKSIVNHRSAAAFKPGGPEETARVTQSALAAMACLESEAVGRCWEDASLSFKKNVNKEKFVSMVEATRSTWGKLRERRLRAVEFTRDINGFPPGQYARASFDSTYSQDSVEERVLFYDQGGVWVLTGYRTLEPR